MNNKVTAGVNSSYSPVVPLHVWEAPRPYSTLPPASLSAETRPQTPTEIREKESERDDSDFTYSLITSLVK